MSETERGLGASAIEGVAWQGVTSIAIRVLRAAVFLLLARLIAPEAYGIVALAGVFVTVLRVLVVGGFSNAIIQQPELRTAHLDTGFWSSTAVGAVVSGGLALTAGPISRIMHEPDLRPVLLALSVVPLLAGLSIVCEGALSRRLQFRSLSIRHLAAAALSTAVAVVLALLGAGVWALVAQTLLEVVVSLVALWLATSRFYRPGRQVTVAALRDLYSYGVKVTLFDLMELVSTRSDDFLVGAVLGSRALGVYSVAYRLLTIILESLQGVSSSVAFPLFSRISGEPRRLSEAFVRASRFNMAVSGPIFVFMALAAPQVVQVTLGSQWDASAPVMRALALAGLATIVLSVNNNLLSATGHPGQVLAFSVVSAALNVLGFAVTVRMGIVWVAAAFAVRAWLLVPVSFWLTGRRLRGTGAILRGLAPVVLGLWVPVAGGLATLALGPRLGDLLALLVVGAVMVPTYVVSTRLLAPTVYRDVVALLDRLLGRVVPAGLRK